MMIENPVILKTNQPNPYPVEFLFTQIPLKPHPLREPKCCCWHPANQLFSFPCWRGRQHELRGQGQMGISLTPVNVLLVILKHLSEVSIFLPPLFNG